MNNVTQIRENYVTPVFPIVKSEDGSFIHQIDEGVHSGFIRGDGEASVKAKNHLDNVTRVLTELNVSLVKLNPNHAETVKNGLSATGRNIEEARNTLKTEQKRLTDGLIAKSNFKADAVLTSMVIGTFQSLDPNERVNALGKLIEQGDGPTLAILDGVSNVFTGLTDELKATIQPRLFAKTDPQNYARLEDTRFNLNRIELASIACVYAGVKFMAPMHKAAAAPKEVHKSMVD